MLLDKNKIIIACAGSGKTTSIVDEALKLTNKRVLLTTYTNENVSQIKDYFITLKRCIPANIAIQSWFSFLLQEGVRPYQNYVSDLGRVQSICFFSNVKESIKLKKKIKFIPESKDEHYLTETHYIYEDKVSKFICRANERSNGLVIKRLEKIYDYIFIDELQDFAGYDLTLLELFFNSNMNIVAVGDPRQATFSTNNALKNKKHRKSQIYAWLKEKERVSTLRINEITHSHRCNQHICDFADNLYPEFPKTESKNTTVTGHDGVFLVKREDVAAYINMHGPVILRYSKAIDALGYPATNIGTTKGRTFDRVLIFPTKPMVEYLLSGDISKAGDKSKLYVAVTRARWSVGFVVDDVSMRKKETKENMVRSKHLCESSA